MSSRASAGMCPTGSRRCVASNIVISINIMIIKPELLSAGNLSILELALASNELPANIWEECRDACASAAKHGHLDVLKWLRARGAQWCWTTCEAAALGGHLEVCVYDISSVIVCTCARACVCGCFGMCGEELNGALAVDSLRYVCVFCVRCVRACVVVVNNHYLSLT